MSKKMAPERLRTRGLHMEALESRHLLTVGLIPGNYNLESSGDRPGAVSTLVDTGSYADYKWHNVRGFADVNDNSSVNARDALLIINECLRKGSYGIPTEIAQILSGYQCGRLG